MQYIFKCRYKTLFGLLFVATIIVIQGCGKRGDNSQSTGSDDSTAANAGSTNSGHVSKLMSASEFGPLLKQHPVVLVDFYADWCGPCRVLKPTIKGIAKRYKDDVKVVAVDIDKFGEIARNFQIQSIPTVKIFKAGSVQKTLVGVYPEKEYASALDKAIAN